MANRSHGFDDLRASISAITVGVIALDPCSMATYLPAARSTSSIRQRSSDGSSPAALRSARYSRVASVEKSTDRTHSSPGILLNTRCPSFCCFSDGSWRISSRIRNPPR
ncbi:hypothetical protein DL765_009895 [Monosporascus sp. GIB2]|nr:hypothetical protein DL765_009895 [Monosporascus sp. GIB2]